MKKPLHILFVEDNPDDVDLSLAELRRAGVDPQWKRVETEEDYLKALESRPEIILSDYAMPQFSGPRALELLKESGLDIPFIIVSGTIGEDMAVQMMKLGASDYLIKDRLVRLGEAVGHALEEYRLRKERRLSEQALRESRAKLDAALASMTDAVFISDAEGRFIEFNDAFASFHRFKDKSECAKKFADYPDILEVFMADGTPAPVEMWAVPRALRGEKVTNAEYTLRRRDTGETWVGSYSFGPIRDKGGAIVGSVVVGRDITGNKKVSEELHKQLDELRRWHEATLGREERILELKKEVNELLARLHQPHRYSTST